MRGGPHRRDLLMGDTQQFDHFRRLSGELPQFHNGRQIEKLSVVFLFLLVEGFCKWFQERQEVHLPNRRGLGVGWVCVQLETKGSWSILKSVRAENMPPDSSFGPRLLWAKTDIWTPFSTRGSNLWCHVTRANQLVHVSVPPNKTPTTGESRHALPMYETTSSKFANVAVATGFFGIFAPKFLSA